MAADMRDRQLWLGNIPHYLDETETLAELALYQVRPMKLMLRRSNARPYAEPSTSIYSCLISTAMS